MDEISTLQKEIAELTTRLATADANNAKAGEYGLKLIEEKSLLEAQYDQLQRDYDNTKVELESTREVIILDFNILIEL
jgi:chromosome segregation ATPase